MQQQHRRTHGQRELPPQRPASPQRAGNLTRKQTRRHRPVQRLDRIQVEGEGDGEDEYDDVWPPIAPSSAIRYTIPPGQYVQGNTRLNVRYEAPPAHQKHAVPRRSSYREEEDIDELETERPLNRSQREGFHIHWMLFLGIGLLIAIGGWMAFSSLGAWWQEHQDDATYGNPRTYQTDAVVGHGDSTSSPSHFIALNLRGTILIIELPGGDAAKARSYSITVIPENQGNPPVKVVFQELNHDGKLDMLVEVGEPGSYITVILFNNGSQFVSKL